MNEKQLVMLGGNINAAHNAVVKAGREMLAAGRKVGEMLLRAKKHVPHGAWIRWQEENLDFTARTAQRYMRIAEDWDSLEPCDTMDNALKQLANPKTTTLSHLEEKNDENSDGVAGKDGANPAAAVEAAEDEEWEYVDEPADGEAEGTEARTDATVLKKRLVATVGAAIREVDRLHDAEPSFPKAEACRQKLDQILKVVNSWRVK